MHRPAPQPALVPIAAAFVAGAALGGPAPSLPVAGLLGAAAAAGAAGTRRRKHLAIVLAAVAAAACGAGLQRAAWGERERTLSASFPGGPVFEGEMVARVATAPERGRRDDRWLHVHIETDGARPGIDARLVIPAPPPDDVRRLDALRHGDRVRLWCRLRPPSARPGLDASTARRRLWSQGLDAVGSVKSSRLVQRIDAGEDGALRRIDRARAAARATLDRALGGSTPARAVIGAMLLGDRALLDDETQRALRDSGLVHILSISGLHTALTIVLLVALLRRSGRGPVGVALAGCAAIVAFTAFVGGGATVLRASAMLAVGLLARVAGRDLDGVSALALASSLLVAAIPRLAMDLGFQLSVLATAGLLALGPSVARALPGPRALAAACGVSVGAYVATAPSLAASFGRLAPVGVIANLAAGLLCACCLAAGAATLALASVPLAGPLAARCAEGSVEALLATARLAAAVPGGHLRVAVPGAPLVALFASTALAVVASAPGRRRRHLAAALAITTVALHVGPRPAPAARTRLDVLDVGQGLSVLLQSADDVALLDAGPGAEGRFDAGDRIVVPAVLARGVRRLAVLALSHGHADHVGGARAVLEDLEVGELWFPAGSEHDPALRTVIDLARTKGVAIRRLRGGDRLATRRLRVEVAHPHDADRRRPINDRCLVLRVVTAEGPAVLLPGDLEAGGEVSLLARASPVAAEALVVPHHGADGSSGTPFLRAVGARVALISAGAGNRFGHPGAHALERLEQAGARVFRTDLHGGLSLAATPTGWHASHELERDRNEREDQHQRESETDGPASGIERRELVVDPGMATAEDEQDDQPEEITRHRVRDERLSGHEDREGGDRRPRDDPVEGGADGEDRMPPVELPDGEQVEGGDEHPDPRRAVDRSDLEVRVPVKRSLQEPRDEGRADENTVRFGHDRRRVGESDADREHGERDREPRDRTRRRDVEERPAGRDLTSNADHGTERADRQRESWNEVRQRRLHPVITAGDEVAHLMGAQDQDDQDRVGEAMHQNTGAEPSPTRYVLRPRSRPEP